MNLPKYLVLVCMGTSVFLLLIGIVHCNKVNDKDIDKSGIIEQKPKDLQWLEEKCWWVNIRYVSGDYDLSVKFETPKHPMGSKTVVVESKDYFDLLKKAVEKVKKNL